MKEVEEGKEGEGEGFHTGTFFPLQTLTVYVKFVIVPVVLWSIYVVIFYSF